MESNGKTAAPGPAAAALDPEVAATAIPSPTYRGLPVEKASDLILLEILSETRRTNEILETFVEAIGGISESMGPLARMFMGGK